MLLSKPGLGTDRQRVCISRQSARRSFVTALPFCQLQTALASAIDVILREDFVNRILPFDSHATREYADIVAARRSAVRAVTLSDYQIAAIVRSRDMTVVTRNARDFEEMDIEVVDP